MEHLAELKLGIDCLLVGAMIYLAVTTFRSGTAVRLLSSNTRAQELRELYGALQGLIRDADSAGQQLQEALARRQRSLEQILSDATTAERRLSDIAESAQNVSRRSAAQHNSAIESAIDEMIPAEPPRSVGKPQLNVFGEPIGADIEEFTPNRSQVRTYQDDVIVPQPAPRAHRGPPASPARAVMSGGVTTSAPSESPATPVYRPQRLAQEVEIERIAERVQQSAQSVRELAHAEVQQTPSVTRPHSGDQAFEFVEDAPIDQISDRKSSSLEQAVEQSISTTSVSSAPGADPRLGVLGMVRRHTQVL